MNKYVKAAVWYAMLLWAATWITAIYIAIKNAEVS